MDALNLISQRETSRYVWRLLAKLVFIVIVMLPVFSPKYALAGMVVTDADLRVLPEYCAVRTRLGTDKTNPKVSHWQNIMGPTYVHLHHYCRALKYFHCAKREVNKKEKNACLKKALGQFDYIISALVKGFPLEAEAHLLKGDTLHLLKRSGEAISEYNRVISIKPDYMKAYRSKAKVLISLGQTPQAIAAIEEGLKVNPRSKSLRRLLRKIKE